ncbi:MAG: response regulator [bacterium]
MEGKILIACRGDECRAKLLNLLTSPRLTLRAICEEADLLLEMLERDYHVIIYDLEISKLDGLKMVKILRKIRPKVALVVISRNPSKELGGKILQEGVAYYGVKPINPEAIKEAVLSALKKRN